MQHIKLNDGEVELYYDEDDSKEALEIFLQSSVDTYYDQTRYLNINDAKALRDWLDTVLPT